MSLLVLRKLFSSLCVAMVVVNGNWSEWTSWTTCSMTCGLGIATRARWCVSPAPAYGGANCTGRGIETMECEDTFCPGKTIQMKSINHY